MTMALKGGHIASGSQLQSKTLGSMQNIPKAVGASTPAHILQQQGQSQNMLNSSLPKGILDYEDEFKNGFPTEGLATISLRWWGSSSPDATEDDDFGDEAPTGQEDKLQSSETAGDCSKLEGEKPDKGNEMSDIGPQGSALLLSVRKRAAEEGRESLKHGECRGYGVYELGRRKKMLLQTVFQSSLPRQWSKSFEP
ncbi:uncharacterized protein LOC122078273 isoform X2 [Macadamia integrifolia]|uniref:uncharacterized protein LOC122078273 isoform X2 n=1 Tax=Macadamia integrifolia TaxID=60698 RepID=UPI001C4E34A0|nr:uncharacterized protein LOC122078273 isoform X2 [Macadamia integrifolia]XP_042500120.1 uncharacterized protein LOC122078273 isoform X2 [Macadamia integrifolia]